MSSFTHITLCLPCFTLGLKIRAKSQPDVQCCSFDYNFGPFKQSLRHLNWTSLTSTEATYPHIRLHQLREEDSLSYFLSMMASIPATMAVILINSENSYTLSSKFYSEEQTPPVPMLVVTKETGGKLLQLVEDNPRDMEAKIELAPGQSSQITSPGSSVGFIIPSMHCLLLS